MFVDALRRRAHWGWLIAVWTPPGAGLYLWARFGRARGPSERAPLRRGDAPRGRLPLEKLRAAAERTPSASNRLAWAHGLLDHGRAGEALEIYEALSRSGMEDRSLLWGLGRARRALGDLAGAVEVWERLVERDKSWQDSEPAHELAALYVELGQGPRALALLREVLQATGALGSAVVLARHLRAAGEEQEAQQVLRRALRDHEDSPPFARRRDKGAAREARAMLR
jgi:hypothetical protein